jgi:hypothetical protein
MIRNHTIFICRVEHDQQNRLPHNGRSDVYRTTTTEVVIASHKEIASGYLLTKYKDKNMKLLSTRVMRIDAFVETHTW